MRKIGFFLVLITIGTAISFSPAYAGSEGSKGPIFLNKIKSVFTRDKKQQVAPLNTQTRPSQKAQRNAAASSSSSASLADIRRAEWKARQQRLGALVARNNQQIQAKLVQNHQQAQRFQAQLQAGETGNTANTGAVNRATGSSNTGTRPTRIIIPQQQDNNSGTKPIFKNYR